MASTNDPHYILINGLMHEPIRQTIVLGYTVSYFTTVADRQSVVAFIQVYRPTRASKGLFVQNGRVVVSDWQTKINDPSLNLAFFNRADLLTVEPPVVATFHSWLLTGGAAWIDGGQP